MGTLKHRKPLPVAYCWNFYHELSAKQIQKNGCRDPIKQAQNPDGVCKWLQMYGKPKTSATVQIRSSN